MKQVPHRNGVLARYIPAVGWLSTYSRSWLRSDILAGLTVWALLVPEGMAYAELAGMPPEAAFFTIPGALLGYALFGTSRQAIVGPTSAIAIMSAAIVASLAPMGTEKFIALTVGLAVMSGALFLLAGMARLGFVSQFFSKSVLVGFLFGLALVIAMWQAPKLLGIETEGGTFFQRVWEFITHLNHTHPWTLFVGVSSLVLMFALKRIVRRVPAALVALVYGIVLVSAMGLEQRGVHIVGQVLTALPQLALPSIEMSDIVGLLPGAFAVVLVAYAETIGAGRKLASEHHYHIDSNQELVALGVSNLSSGLCGGFAVGASLSKSADNEEAGAQTQVSAIVAAGLVLVAAVALTGLFHNIPEATMAAIVIFAVWRLMDVKELKRLYRIRQSEFWLAMAALLGVLLLGVLPGLLLAVTISLLGFIYHASQPHFSVRGKVPGELAYADMERHPDSQPVPGLLIIRPDAPLFFANASYVSDRIRKTVHTSEPPPRAVLLDLDVTDELDIPSADELSELTDELDALDVKVLLARVHDPVLDMLRLTGLADKIGEEHIYLTIDEGVQAFLERPSSID